MDWDASYALRVRAYVVDPDTWADCDELPHVTSATIDMALDKSEIQTGRMDATVDRDTDLIDRYYRIVAETTQNGATSRTDIATMFCTSAPWTNEGGMRRAEMSLSSVLYPAANVIIPDGTFIPSGDNAVSWCSIWLKDCLKAPVTARGSFAFGSYVVFGGGMSVLDAVTYVLNAGGYRLRIGGDGSVTMCPMSDEPSITVTAAGRAFMRDGIKATNNMASIPNRVIVTKDGVTATATNDRKSSKTSIYVRGYPREVYESNPQLLDGETLQGYANRRLSETSVLCEERTYTRDYIGGVFVGDLILAGLQQADLDGSMRCTKQSITCSGRIMVQETARTEEVTWEP